MRGSTLLTGRTSPKDCLLVFPRVREGSLSELGASCGALSPFAERRRTLFIHGVERPVCVYAQAGKSENGFALPTSEPGSLYKTKYFYTQCGSPSSGVILQQLIVGYNMQKTIIVLVVLAVAAIFFWQFFAPQPSPAAQVTLPVESTN